MAKIIMIQGTMSNVGKSLLTAGLCRIFKQDGYKVAPFKSQNMALNSFITKEGLEMGRAQVMQAEAAGTVPKVAMNPILLKPTTDTGSQVIVKGEVLQNMSARDYFAYKKNLVPVIMEAFGELEQEYEIIVIEGAGSPAEINLKNDDIVNMGMAKMAKAPVLLVGDIDRGGVFAQLAGTIMLLEEDEKELIKGLVINKFRGDKTILNPGITMLEDICKLPVMGVVPYIDVQVEDEDSLSHRFGHNGEVKLIDIVVVRLPRISNFTDFNPFELFEEVSLRYVDRVSELKEPDMVIIPGTKNTIEDLIWLRESGLEASILKLVVKGKIIFGICGGYQMLGHLLKDPYSVENGKEIKGMGLLSMETTFSKEKIRTRVKGTFTELKGALKTLSHMEIEGYEIHMGVTNLLEAKNRLTNIWIDKEINKSDIEVELLEDGCYEQNVYGSYVHGIFDKEGIINGIIKGIANEKGLDFESVKSIDYSQFKEEQYDILASAMRKYMNMEEIYRILEEGI